jgi:hypothetical protein
MIIANRVGAWNALPNNSPAFVPVIRSLQTSSEMLRAAGDENACLSALLAGLSALVGLESLLDATGA